MGRPGKPGIQGGRSKWIGTSLGKPQGESLDLCVSSEKEKLTHKLREILTKAVQLEA